MNRLTGGVLAGFALGGWIAFSEAGSVGGKVLGGVIASPACGYYVYRVVREVRGIKEDRREARPGSRDSKSRPATRL